MRPLPLLAALSVLSACTVGPAYHPPEAGLAGRFIGAGGIDARSADGDWWRGFDDPILVALVDKAVARNTDIAQARARITQSRAAARGAGAALLPTLDGTGDASTNSQSRETPVGKVTEILGLPRGYDSYSAGAQASWEIDLFGGLRRGREAARAELQASEADAGATAIAISAETADAYLTLRALQSRLRVATELEGSETRLVELVRQRFEQGVSAERELNRTTAALQGIRAQMSPLRAGMAAQLNRLDVLVGDQPGTNRATLVEARPIPGAPMPSGSAEPSSLLRHRPDVIAAERRLAAANARIGVAVADFYPRLSLSGLLGVASLGTSTLFTGGAVEASGGAGIRWRLFDFGRVDAEVAGARGRQAEALASWRGSVLVAAEEVETALARLSEAHVERAALSRQVAALTTARDQSRQAYEGGVVSLIDVTDADRELLTASDRLEGLKGDEARAAVAAYRALGGGWVPENPANVAMATR